MTNRVVLLAFGGLLCGMLPASGCCGPIVSACGGGVGAGGLSGPGASCGPGDVQQVEANCVCQVFSDCEDGNDATWACSNAQTCIQTCQSSSDCTTAPNTICEDEVCRPPACGNDSECAAGEQCIASACRAAFAADSVATCLIVPAAAVMNAGGSRPFHVLSYDANGLEIAYEGAVTFDLEGPAGLSEMVSATDPTAAIVSGTSLLAAGSGTLAAQVGATTCTPASVVTFAAAPENTLRVTVADRFAGTPITDATVVDGQGNTLTAAGDGTYTETVSTASLHTFTAYREGYSYVTVVDTSATDVFLPLKPEAAPGTFTGTLADTDFNNLSTPTGTVHIAFGGASIPGNAIDLPLAALLGGPASTNINLGGTSATTAALPQGLVLGLGPTMFKGSSSVEAAPGVRALWTLGGNLLVQTMLDVLATQKGQTPDLAQMLIGLAPSLGQLESGVTGGLSVTSGKADVLSTGGGGQGSTSLTLETLLRLHLSAALPELPSWYQSNDLPGAPSGQLDGAVVLGGVLAEPQGFVPLGIAGAPNDTLNNMPNMVAGFMGGPDGSIPLRMAPRSGGLEGFPYMAVALAVDMAGLNEALNGAASSVTLSGTVLLPGELAYAHEAVTTLTSPPFLGLPAQPTFSVATRQLSLPVTDVPGVAFHRLEIGTAPNEWEVYFPPGETVVQIPSPPLADPLQSGAGAPVLQLASVTLGLNGDGSGATYTYDDVVGFQTPGPTLDDLTLQIDSFSIEGVPAGGD